jgi:hypothetical protein
MEELETVFINTLKSPDKSLEYIQTSLRSALDIYREGGHVTPTYKDQIFRMHFDNRRIIQAEVNDIDIDIDVILNSLPVPNKEYCATLRYVSKVHKTRIYHKNTSSRLGNKYRNYTELAIRTFLKGIFADKYNIDKSLFSSYNDIIDFIKNYDNKARVSKQGLSSLKNRKIVLKPVPRDKNTDNFVAYVKKKMPGFNDKDFFV